MSFILTVVCESPGLTVLNPDSPRSFLVRAVSEDGQAWSRAGYLPGLRRRLGYGVSGCAFHIVRDEGDGYETSNCFFPYPDDDEAPVTLRLPASVQAEFEHLLKWLMDRSTLGRVLVVAEYNGAVTSPDSNEEVDLVGPINISEFWRLHDAGEILEESIVVLEESMP